MRKREAKLDGYRIKLIKAADSVRGRETTYWQGTLKEALRKIR